MKYYRQEPLRHVGDVTAMGAERYGEKLAVEYRGAEYSYATLDARANRVANALVDVGIGPDDRVAIYAENSLLFPEALFGIVKTGAVAVPLNTRMDADRLRYVLRDSGARALIVSESLSEAGTELAGDVETAFVPGGAEGFEDYDAAIEAADPEFETADRAFDDVALQCYTSGTTGDPKGVLTTHRNVLSTVQSYLTASGVDPETNVTLCVLPLFHMYGLNTVLVASLYAGRSVVLKAVPEAEALLEAITDYGVTTFSAVPAIYVEMVEELEADPHAYDVTSIDRLGCGAAPLADDTRRRIERAFDTPLLEGWGMTETTPAGTRSSVYGERKGAGCIGSPIPDVEIKLVDPDTRETKVPVAVIDPRSPVGVDDAGIEPGTEAAAGEIAIRGPQVFEGYHGLPEKTRAVFDDEGFFYTDDIARVDADGELRMVDRADDMLIVGGENVYPAEVEDALFEHPEIQAAAVVGAPHEVKGEAPVAFVVPKDGADLTERDVREFSLERVATYAHPRRVFFVEELPRGGTRKVQRFKLEEDVEKRLEEPLKSSERL